MLVLRPPFTRQPQAGLRLDRGNPLARSITHCLPLNGNSAEIVTGAQLTRKSGYAQIVDSRGVSLKGTGSASASVPINLAGRTLVAVSFWLYWDTFTNDDKFAMEFGPDINSAAGFYVDPNSSSAAAPGCFEGGSRGSGSSAYGAQFCSQPTAAAWHHCAINFDALHAAGLSAIYIDGTSRALTNPVTATQSGTLPSDVLHLFSRNDASLFGAGRMQNLIIRGGYALSAAEVLAEYRNPWQIYAPPARRFWAPSSAGISGTLAKTLANVTLSSAGTLPIAGTTTQTLGAATLSAAGTVALAGTLAQTLGAATLSSAGTVALTGTLASTLADATLSSAAALALAGQTTATLADATLSAAGSVALAGTLAQTLADATLSSAATLALAGTEASQLADATLAAAATLALAGTAADTLEDCTLSAAGAAAGSGDLAQTLADATLAADSTLALGASAAITLAPATLAAAGTIALAGTLAKTLEDATLSSAGAVLLVGSASLLLDDCTIVAAGTGGTATALSPQHAAWLEAITRSKGLIDPLVVDPTSSRSDGTLIQTISRVGDIVTLTPVAVPTGADEPSALTPMQAGWLESLMRELGLIDPLVVSATGRSDGTLTQSISTAGGVTTITRI